MKPDHPIGLFKGGDAVHMEQLLKEGVVYMNTIGYFRKTENDLFLRRDPHEGTEYHNTSPGMEMAVMMGGKWQSLGQMLALTVPDEKLSSANIYCLYAKKYQDLNSPFQLAPLGFEAFVFFRDADEFFRSVRKEGERLKQRIDINVVRYVDRKTFTGRMGPFTKFSEYAVQNELRIVATPGIGEPLRLVLGDLSDIAIPVDAAGTFQLAPGEDRGTVKP